MITAALSYLMLFGAAREDAPRISPAKHDGGVLVHDVTSEFQEGRTQIRVLLPETITPGEKLPVVYVLPVEAKNENRYGDGLLEVKEHKLHDKHQAIFVAPTFSHLPWYADHPSEPTIRQESYFLQVVLPFVEKTYPARADSKGRLLLGFSKSGWGAWSLLLRNPELFARAAAWDAPLMMDQLGKYGTAPIFGSQANFEKYKNSELLRQRAEALRSGPRLVLLGEGNFAQDHKQMHSLLDELRILHEYRDGPQRIHNWHSGWLPEAADLLLNAPAR